MDFDRYFAQRQLEADTSPGDSRLKKNENGMVLLPRTFYNKHPAKSIMTDKRQKERDAAIDRRRSKRSKPNASEHSADDAPDLADDVRETANDTNSAEYKLMFCDPANGEPPVAVVPTDFTLQHLSESIEPDNLPSPMWEIERIPPMINFAEKTDSSYDAIAAELEALMGETKKCDDVKPEPIPPSIIVDGSEPELEPAVIAINGLPEIEATESEIPTATESSAVSENPPDQILSDESPVENKTEEVKAHDEYPSIMDILNEPPTQMETDVEEPPKEPVVVDEVKEKTEDEKEPAAVVKPDDPPPESKESTNNNEKYVLKSVIFRRLTSDKQTYDRLVTFYPNMEYFVAINDTRVELLGAPDFIESIDDLQILLQIVDNSSLNSFNVILKS